LQLELAQTANAASGVGVSAGQQEKVNAELRHYEEKAAKAERAISQWRLELAQSANAASGVGDSAGQQEKVNAELRRYKEKAEKAESTIVQLRLELAQYAIAASGDGDSAGRQEFDPSSAQANKFANKIVDSCMSLTRKRIEAMRLEHDKRLQECEQRNLDAEAAHEQHVEQLHAQVIHFHDLAMKAVDGDAAGTLRAERPLQSSPAPATATATADGFDMAMSRFTAFFEEEYRSGRAPGTSADTPYVAGVPPPVKDVAASSVNPTAGDEGSSFPPPPVPHAVPRRAVRPTSIAFPRGPV